jgi:hypothetical protein
MFINQISPKYGGDLRVPVHSLNRIQFYIEENTNFQPEAVGSISTAAKSLDIWATVLNKFEVTD